VAIKRLHKDRTEHVSGDDVTTTISVPPFQQWD